MKIKKTIRDGEHYPRGYGFAYYDFKTYRIVCYPIPLNVLIITTRYIWAQLLHPRWFKDIEMIGYNRGYKMGEKMALEQAKGTNGV